MPLAARLASLLLVVRPAAARDVLVFGGNGCLGLEFVQAAHRVAETTVTVASRGTDYWGSAAVLASLGVRHVRCDRDAPSVECVLTLNGTSFDAVVDFSAQSGEHVTAAAALVRTAHYVLVSSAAVYAPSFSGRAYAEDDVPPPGQRGFLQSTTTAFNADALRKLEQEDALWAAAAHRGLCASVLRLPPVIGRRDGTNRLAQLLLMLEMEDVPLSPSGTAPISFVDAPSVASAALAVLSGRVEPPSPHRCCGKAFNVAQPPASLEDVLRVGANATNATLRTSASLLSPTFAEAVYGPVSYSSLLPFILDTTRLAALGWVPAQPLEHAVADAAAFLQAELLRPRAPTFDDKIAEALAGRVPIALAASPQGMAVLRRYRLPVPFEQPEGWPRPHRAGQARLPTSYLVVVLGALGARLLLSPRLVEPVAFGLLLGWWLLIIVVGALKPVTMGTAFWVRDVFGFHPPFWLAIFSELGLGILSAGFCSWAVCSRHGARFERDATAAVRGVGARFALYTIRLTVLFFLLGHKISLRFHGDGLGGVPRPHIEFTWPILIITHEAFLTWTDGFLVFVTYGGFSLAVCRTLHAALGQVLLTRSRRSLFIFALPVSLAVMVSVFETHHTLEEAKLLKFAGTTGCIWITLVWLAFLPAFGLLALCRLTTPGWLSASQAAVAAKVPASSKGVEMRQSSADDREALVGADGVASHAALHAGGGHMKGGRKKGRAGGGADHELDDADEPDPL